MTWDENYPPILTQLVGKKSGNRYVELDLEPVMIAVIKLNSSESLIHPLNIYYNIESFCSADASC